MTNPWNDHEKPEANNPWAPKDTAPSTAEWGDENFSNQQQFDETGFLEDAGTMESVPPTGNSNRLGMILVGLIIVLALAVIGVVAWLYLSGRMGSGEQESSGQEEMVAQAVESSSEESSSEEADESESPSESFSEEPSQEEESGAAAHSVGRQPSAKPVVTQLPDEAREAGLTLSGWSDNSATRCTSSENLVYAGRASDAWITVCESNGEMTYRSDIFGGTLVGEVDQSRSNPERGEFYVDASPAVINVVGGGVEVLQDGEIIAEKNFPSAWVLD